MSGWVKLGAQSLAVAAVAALAAVLVWRLTHETPPPKAGAPAPSFSLHRLDGTGAVSLRSLRGKTVVLNFWASWCDPCKREAPALEQLWRQYRGRGVVVLGVDSGDARSDANRFLSAHGITYPIVVDPNLMVAANHYGVPGFPATFVIDPQGRVVGGAILGPISDKGFSETFHRDLETALRS
jgi:cytochrome c biogenesis protein CcmG, thiol:disulfide interchange protein DsbE